MKGKKFTVERKGKMAWALPRIVGRWYWDLCLPNEISVAFISSVGELSG
jgi:hypothetical protein